MRSVSGCARWRWLRGKMLSGTAVTLQVTRCVKNKADELFRWEDALLYKEKSGQESASNRSISVIRVLCMTGY